jgi:hypothetical protein
VRKISGAKRNHDERWRKITAPISARIANHLALIRSFLIDSGHSRTSREANCVKNFQGAIALHKIAIDTKFTTHAREKFSRAAFVSKLN